jgi:uncharacterized membrane protein YecN with MAPEG domain
MMTTSMVFVQRELSADCSFRDLPVMDREARDRTSGMALVWTLVILLALALVLVV